MKRLLLTWREVLLIEDWRSRGRDYRRIALHLGVSPARLALMAAVTWFVVGVLDRELDE